MKFVKAERRQKKLRLALGGPSGAGKTYSSLALASGLGGKIALIDTERGSGSLYAEEFDFDILDLGPPHSPRRYVEAIRAAEKAGYGVIVIDSLSHAWMGEGGALEMHDEATAASKSKNSYVAWREVTPEHNALVGAMLDSTSHIIATMRSKTEYVQDGKEVKKVGMEMIQRQGMEFEFDLVWDVSNEKHLATPSKTRIKIFDGTHAVISADTGRQLLEWLSSAKPAPAPSPTHSTAPAPAPAQEKASKPIDFSTIPDLSKFGITMPSAGNPLIGTPTPELLEGMQALVALSKRFDLGSLVVARAQAWVDKYQEIIQKRLEAEQAVTETFKGKE